MTNRAPILTVRNLHLAAHRRGSEGRRLLDIEALDLAAAEILGVVGPSGAGKTLLALSLMGLVREHGVEVEGGQVDFEGVDMLAGDDRLLDRVRGRRIAMAFQEPLAALDPVSRARNQLLEPLRSLTGLDKPAKEARIADCLASVGLPHHERLLDAFPRRDLSGGERQRLLLALATILEPRILIADEPSAQLDPVLRADLARFLRRASEERGMASVMISHDEALVRSVSDRVLMLRDGRIEQEPRRSVMRAVPGPPAMPHGAEVVVEARGLVRFGGTGRGRTEILNGVDLTLHRGEFMGVLGPSGAGKTTLLRCLVGLTPPDAGSLSVSAGRAARGKANAIQMIFQDPGSSLDPLMSVGETIAEGFGRGSRAADRRADILALLDLMGLPASLFARLPSHLSGGERQRVAIARALAARPSVLLADEPATALDAASTAKLVHALEAVRAERPETACLIVSHDIALLTRLCATAAVMEQGIIVEQAAMEDILARPRMAATRDLIEASRRLAQGPV